MYGDSNQNQNNQQYQNNQRTSNDEEYDADSLLCTMKIILVGYVVAGLFSVNGSAFGLIFLIASSFLLYFAIQQRKKIWFGLVGLAMLPVLATSFFSLLNSTESLHPFSF